MYKWPKEHALSIFQGMAIQAITFTINTIVIVFEEGLVLTVESCLRMRTNDDEEVIPIPASSTKLVSLVGKCVQACELDADGASLLLKFGDNIRLRLEGGDEAYECFHVKVNGKELTI